MSFVPQPVAPALGPLRPPAEDELAEAYRKLRDETLTLSWAAAALGVQADALRRLALAGELVVVPGPWPMRERYASGLGYFVPGWQLEPGGGVRPGVAALVRAAAEAGWTSLDLHRFMTAPAPGGEAPAQLLRREGEAPVLALLAGAR